MICDHFTAGVVGLAETDCTPDGVRAAIESHRRIRDSAPVVDLDELPADVRGETLRIEARLAAAEASLMVAEDAIVAGDNAGAEAVLYTYFDQLF